MEYLPQLFSLLQILLLDLSMAGDNVLAVAMAAAGLPAGERRRAVLIGIVGATVLRIVFAVFAVQLLHITGLLAAGGLLLLWVAWKLYGELRHIHKTQAEVSAGGDAPKKLSAAVWQIVAADVSMSLDNVLGVAGVARDDLWVLAAGLTLSVVLMGVASGFVARLTARYPWAGYLGLVVILYTAGKMIWDGGKVFLWWSI